MSEKKEHSNLKELWEESSLVRRFELLDELSFQDAQYFFHLLSAEEQYEFIKNEEDRANIRKWIFILPLDDLADLIQFMDDDERREILGLLPHKIRREIQGLLAYEEDVAGGLMNPKFVKLRLAMKTEEAMGYIRAQAKTTMEVIYYAYVVDQDDVLKGVLSFRDLLIAPTGKMIEEIMQKDFIFVTDDDDQEVIAKILTEHNLYAIPVVDDFGVIKGIVTFDDMASVLQEETTEDIQRIGGMEALDAPYWSTDFIDMIKKRAGWLVILFVGEMFTASAMSHYEDDIKKAVVLAMFVPLIISSGGNSGSQASTLIIRAIALGEVTMKDWWRVLKREAMSGLVLGCILATIGFFRIIVWQKLSGLYGPHYFAVAETVAFSLIGIVLWGTLSGSFLPLVLKRIGFDPASASAPFVATLVDVTGLVIYFSIANYFLKGIML